ncbi:MAG: hypothetical protein JEY79_07065 [Pseudodesulfovibrio sp.]|nr:hypothetical protein [Pseudodesulfovibrio sp.]
MASTLNRTGYGPETMGRFTHNGTCKPEPETDNHTAMKDGGTKKDRKDRT